MDRSDCGCTGPTSRLRDVGPSRSGNAGWKGSKVAKGRTRGARKSLCAGVPVRIAKHIARLDLYSPADYLDWCRARGFAASTCKTWGQLEAEWIEHGRKLGRARARCRVDRDPARLLVEVCGGSASAADIARPRWRALAERIERARLTREERAALQRLAEVAARRARLLLAEVNHGGETYPLVDGLMALARRHRRWIRRPAAWRPRSHNAKRQFAGLVRHVVASYPVPAFLDAAWLRRDASRFQEWYLAIGAGARLRPTGGPLRLTRRMLHHFLKAPEDYKIEHALRWGQVHALGGDRRLADAVVSSRLGTHFENEEFWSSVIRFFVRHPQLACAQVAPIVDYLQHQRFEVVDAFLAPGVRAQQPPPQPNLSMKGRSLESLLRAVERWHRELGRGRASALEWEPSGVGELEWETGTPGKTLRVWRIRELLSGRELHAEGRAMRHCVASYAQACARGSCSIWTVELHAFEGVSKRLTIELSPSGVVVQCRGRFNALPGEHELAVVRRWADQEGLQLGRFPTAG